MGIKFDKDSLAAEQNNYLTKIVDVTLSMVYKLGQKSLSEILR